jgi:nitronate monooxygenase
MNAQPTIIQGGMGAGVSNWRLANAVARQGQLGVVSGTAIDVILARRLQGGDPGGHMRRALAHFPAPELAQRVLDRYFAPEGIGAQVPYRAKPIPTVAPRRPLLELTIVANFVEVYLAKEGHDGPVGINLLEKIQLPNLASLYGAMLAGVDYVLMGAGIPIEIPGALDRLANHEPARMKLHVAGATAGDAFASEFNPRRFISAPLPPLRRPAFLAIIASATLALTLAKRATGYVDGFIIEGPTAGGHNAPPRGALQLNERGEPVYGPRDEVDLAKVAALGRPFWLAGSYGTPERLQEALALGAAGVQVGTAFAFCRESGLADDVKRDVLWRVARGETMVHTDPLASPTGFPFKIVQLPGSASSEAEYAARPRICDLGYLRELYKREDGTIGYRCPAEPIDDYLDKGGDLAETTGRKCLCNGLIANIGLGQRRAWGYLEPPLVTAGDDLINLVRLLPPGVDTYGAADVLHYLLTPRAANH